jgi:hypothetical protein
MAPARPASARGERLRDVAGAIARGLACLLVLLRFRE